MEKEKLINAAKSLNATVYNDEEKDQMSQLITKNIKINGVKIEELTIAFMEACNSIPEELEQFIPDEVSDVYNAIGDEMEALKNDTPAEETNPTKDKNPAEEKLTKLPKKKSEKDSSTKKEPRYTRGDALIAALKKGGDAKTICENIDTIYIANGGKENFKESKWIFGIMFPILIKINAIVEKDGKFQANF